MKNIEIKFLKLQINYKKQKQDEVHPAFFSNIYEKS
jgi:hypothetical protein